MYACISLVKANLEWLYTNTFLLHIVVNIDTTQAGKNQPMSEIVLQQLTSMQIIVESHTIFNQCSNIACTEDPV